LNHSLRHGIALKEANYIEENFLSHIKGRNLTFIGFSTGCYVCLLLAAKYPMKTILLCNPAEIVTRLSKTSLEVLCPDWYLYPYVKDTHRLIKRGTNTTMYWWAMQVMVSVIWYIGTCISCRCMSHIYYQIHGKHVNEPRPDELERGLFRHPFHSLQTTITECLVKTDYHTCQSGKIHLLVGANDFYRHFSRRVSKYRNAHNYRRSSFSLPPPQILSRKGKWNNYKVKK